MFCIQWKVYPLSIYVGTNSSYIILFFMIRMNAAERTAHFTKYDGVFIENTHLFVSNKLLQLFRKPSLYFAHFSRIQVRILKYTPVFCECALFAEMFSILFDITTYLKDINYLCWHHYSKENFWRDVFHIGQNILQCYTSWTNNSKISSGFKILNGRTHVSRRCCKMGVRTQKQLRSKRVIHCCRDSFRWV